MLLHRKQKIIKHSDATVFEPETSYLEDYPLSERSFAYIDVSGYTNLTNKYGVHIAAQRLHKFRNAVRIVVGKHGVRVATWLGDGVLLVSIDTTPLLQTVAELSAMFNDMGFQIHAGIACGSVIIFEGNDYVGEPINIAARLADYAKSSEILGHNIVKKNVPKTMKIKMLDVSIPIRGIGKLSNVCSLQLAEH